MPRSFPRRRARLVCCSLVAVSIACAHAGPELVPDEDVRIAPQQNAVKYHDCPEALRRASLRPDLEVDRLPSPKRLVPAPIPVKSMPEEVRTARYSEVRVTVLIDTLGRPDMKTFTVVKSTHPWLASSVKSAVAKWSFQPAELAGCKVPRVFKWAATAGRPAASRASL
jgi:outer membrane biosynthesis protein TonB